MIKLPQNKTWIQDNNGDTSSDLWSSFNLNLTREIGKTKISPRMLMNTNNITDLGTAIVFKVFSSKIWTIAGSYVFVAPNTKTGTAFAKAALGSDPSTCSSDYSDAEIYNSKLFIATATTLAYTDGASWANSTNGTGLTQVPHKLLAFRKTGRLYMTDSIAIYSLSNTTLIKTPAAQYTYTLGLSDASLEFTSMLQTDDYIWILTQNLTGDLGYIILWDGVTADTAFKKIQLTARGALAGIIKDGTPYIITSDARLQYYNGGAFVDVPNGKLPVLRDKYLKNPFSTVNDRWIHPNGITIVDGRINILINNENYDNSTTINENLASGIWEFDPDIGWYHKNSLSQFDSLVGTILDYGQNRLSRVGALANLKTDNNSSDTYIGTLLAGATYFSNATTTATGIWTDDSLDSLKKYGYVVTKKIFSPLVTDSFTNLYCRLKPFLNVNDKIVVKYRTTDLNPTEGTITWSSTTSFSTSVDLTNYAVGDEVEITQGIGSGMTAHITYKQAANGGAYIITLDETFTGATGTAKARFQKWKKIKSFTGAESMFDTGVISTSPWIQLKICMLHTGNNEVYDFTLENTPSIQLAQYQYK